MNISRTAVLLLAGLVGAAHAAGPWDGDYTVKVTGQNVSFNSQPAERNISDTTTMKIQQTGSDVSVTFGTFASSMATAIFEGKVGNEKISANWWHAGSPHELHVLWGTRKGTTIQGTLMYPRTAKRAGLVPGWTLVNWTATPKRGGVKPRAVHLAAAGRVSAAKLQPARGGTGIDPAAQQISFRILNKTSPFNGRVQITGLVKNVGNKPFLNKGRPGAAAIHLYEGNRLVVNKPMNDLQPGATQSVTYTRNWQSSSPAEGEFPPTYKLWLMYDPDIAMDSNPDNDDVRSQNNRIEKSGMEINTLFRK